MTQKIKVTAEMEIEDDVAIDGLSMDTSLGLLGTIKSYDIDYEKKKELGPKLTYDEVKERYFHKDLRKDVIRTQIISAFMTQESDKFHDFAVDAIDEAVLKQEFVEIPEQDQELVTEILNDEFYHEVLAKKELKDKHGIE
tara:strand:+ start:372 stop:791 length:420 start_codon:yes stop_codon:yes gene_type:complete